MYEAIVSDDAGPSVGGVPPLLLSIVTASPAVDPVSPGKTGATPARPQWFVFQAFDVLSQTKFVLMIASGEGLGIGHQPSAVSSPRPTADC